MQHTVAKSHDSHMTDLCYRVQQLLHGILRQLAEGGLEVLWDSGVGGGKSMQVATESQHIGEPEHSTTNCGVKGIQGRQQSEGEERDTHMEYDYRTINTVGTVLYHFSHFSHNA